MLLRRYIPVGLAMLLSATYSSGFLITHHKDITETGLSLALQYSLPPTLVQALGGKWFTGQAMGEILNANWTKDVGDCSKLGSGDDTPAVACYQPTSYLTPTEIYQGNYYSKINSPYDHFDDETFGPTNTRLSNARTAAVTYLKSARYVAARKQVGFALHTLQDFYAHSNWIDLGKACCADGLGVADAYVAATPGNRATFVNMQVARRDEPTCPDDPSILLSDQPQRLRDRLDPVIALTSGYFPRDRTEIKDFGKCAHGDLVVRGINKDDTDTHIFDSDTRAARYNDAFLAAEAHTTKFTKGILIDGCGTDSGCVLGFLGYPRITSIDPSTADASNGAFALHVVGAGFTESVTKSQPTVLWNGTPLQTTLTDPTGGTKLDARVETFNLKPGPVKVSVKQFEIDSSGDVTTNVLESNAVDFNLITPKLDCPGAIRPHYHDDRFMDVNANQWNDTGRMVKAGEILSIQVVPMGWVVWRAGGLLTGATGEAQPQGDTRATPNTTLLWVEPPMPISVAPIGALIGMVVDKQHLDESGKPTMPLIEKPEGVKWFRILSGGQFIQPVPIDGRLYLGINDGAFFNNGGCFQIRFLK